MVLETGSGDYGWMDKASSLPVVQERLAANLRRLREEKGIPQERFGWEAGVDRSYYGRIERGTANPSLNVLCRMADLLDVDVSVLLQPVKGTRRT